MRPNTLECKLPYSFVATLSRESKDGVFWMPDLSVHPISDKNALEEKLESALSTRIVDSTRQNAASSRSHAVFTFHVKRLVDTANGTSRR